MIYPSETIAFKISSVIPILRKYGIQLDSEKSASTDALTPTYAKDYLHATYIDPESVILLLCGVNPSHDYYDQDGYWNDGSPVRNYRKYSELILTAIDNQQLNTVHSKNNKINQDQIRSWCSAMNIYWPIPTNGTAFANTPLKDQNSEIEKLQDQLKEASSQLKEQEANSKFIRDLTLERDNLKDENLKLKIANFDLEAEIDDAKQKISALERDIISGKSRSFLLEILGGLTTSLLYVDIFKSGNIEIGKVTSALDSVGINATPETVSNYLKQAAARLSDSGKADTVIEYLKINKG